MLILLFVDEEMLKKEERKEMLILFRGLLQTQFFYKTADHSFHGWFVLLHPTNKEWLNES